MPKHSWGISRPEPIFIKTKKEAKALLNELSKCDVLALDTETTGLDIAKDTIIFWSLSKGDDRYFLEADKLRIFKPLFLDPGKIWVGSQIKYDFHMCANSGVKIVGDMMCTLTMDRLLDPEQDHGLKEAYEREFDEKMMTFAETFYPRNAKGQYRRPPKKSLQEIMLEAWERDPDKVIDYASLDAWGVFRLWKRLRKKLKKIKTYQGYTLWDVFIYFEVPMSRILYEMERRGCQLDINYLETIGPAIQKEIDEVEFKLNKLVGEPINPRSSKQLVELFYENKKLQPIAFTSGGSSGKKTPSVNAAVLEHHAEEGVEEAKLLLKHRELTKILSTYINGLIERADKNGVIHTTFNQHVADTGRLSSSNPNLQNQPRPRESFDIRKAFIPRKGYTMIVADYDQLEMYILGDYSNDPGLMGNIQSGKDIHTGNVELVFGEPYDEVAAAKKNKKDESERANYLRKLRNDIKVICFGLNYGKAENSLARELGYFDDAEKENPNLNDWEIKTIAKNRAKKLIELYFKKIPGAAKFIKGTYKRAAKTKYVETFIGRRRWLYQIMDLKEKHEHMRLERQRSRGKRELCWCNDCKASREGERRSANTIIQGSAADIVMCAMISCFYDKRLEDLGVHMLLQVHDELVLECPTENVDEACKYIQENMEHPFGIQLNVPLRAEPGKGKNWVEAK